MVKQAEKKQETTVEFLASLAAVLVVGLFIITFVLQAFEIPSSSMENTLLIGDHVFVDRVGLAPRTNWIGPLFPYRDIKRGDVLVFMSPAEPGLHLVKRIIGLPGDRIHLKDGVVYRNGQKLEEPYVIHSIPGAYNPYAQNFPSVPASEGGDIFVDWQLTMQSHIDDGDIVVPANSYFAMGDNRDVSADSRYWGFVPQENVIGRPMFIYWSFEESEMQSEQKEISQRVAFAFHVILHFFDSTRWRRMLRTVH
ncbi:MAG TPA: signal peptidase I [Terriglobales bacterium]